MAVDIVVKNGKVVTTEGVSQAAIAITGEKIVAIGAFEALPPARKIIDANSNFVIPGLVDAHMHLNYPFSADMGPNLRTETQAAAAGGCTTVINVLAEHGSGSIVEASRKYVQTYEANGYVDLSLNTLVGNMAQIKEMRAALEHGISSFKFLLPYKGRVAVHSLNLPEIDDGLLYRAFDQIGKLAQEGFNTFARVHAEGAEVHLAIMDSYREQGKEPATYSEIRPSFIELEAMQRVITFARATHCPIYIVHMTIKEGPAEILKARLEGLDIMAETCPQYLVLNTDNTDKLKSKTNPPIRQKEDNEALWHAIKEGIISVIGTDHSPISKAVRGTEFWEAPCGTAEVETWLPIMLSEGVHKRGLPLEKVVELCCYNPAKKYGLTPRKGMLATGSDADLVIVDLNKKAKVNGQNLFTQAADNSCYEGWEFQGWPVLTMVRGSVVMENGKITGKPGSGKFIPAKVKLG